MRSASSDSKLKANEGTNMKNVTKICGEPLAGQHGFRALCCQQWGTEHSHHDLTAEMAVNRGLAIETPFKVGDVVTTLGTNGELQLTAGVRHVITEILPNGIHVFKRGCNGELCAVCKAEDLRFMSEFLFSALWQYDEETVMPFVKRVNCETVVEAVEHCMNDLASFHKVDPKDIRQYSVTRISI